MYKKIERKVLFVIAMLAISGSAVADIVIHDPWVRAAPPTAPAMAAFMKIENTGGKAVALVDAHTDGYGKIELHRTMKADGMMKMIQQKNIPVAANSTTVLKPGSWHIMLIKPEKVPAAGSHKKITLTFDDGSKQTVNAVVRKGKMMMKHNMMHKH